MPLFLWTTDLDSDVANFELANTKIQIGIYIFKEICKNVINFNVTIDIKVHGFLSKGITFLSTGTGFLSVVPHFIVITFYPIHLNIMELE